MCIIEFLMMILALMLHYKIQNYIIEVTTGYGCLILYLNPKKIFVRISKSQFHSIYCCFHRKTEFISLLTYSMFYIVLNIHL